jgi:hypothetical protein
MLELLVSTELTSLLLLLLLLLLLCAIPPVCWIGPAGWSRLHHGRGLCGG